MDEAAQYYLILVVALLPWISYAFVVTFFFLSIFYGRCRLYQPSDPRNIGDQLPGITILKPLMGIDPYLESNLESHFTLKYPKFEILACVADDQDPAIALVRRLQERYPLVDCRLFIGGKDGIVNPLIQNMSPAYESSKYDVMWVSTSRIKASTEILLDMISKLNNHKVALVHQMPFTTDQEGLAAAIEKIYFGASVAKYYLAFHMLGISCFTGMSYLMRKTHLEDIDGISYFGQFLAEDFFLAKHLHEKGFCHQVAAIPAQQNVASPSIVAYKDRMVRWLRLRLNMMPVTAGFLEPLGESIPLGIFASWSANYLFGINPYVWFTCHVLVWFSLDYIQLKGIQNGQLPFSFPMYAVAWIIRELLYLHVYFEALCNVRRVRWGKRTYFLSNFGKSLRVANEKPLLHI